MTIAVMIIFVLLFIGFYLIIFRPPSKFSIQDMSLQSKRLAITKKRIGKLEKIRISIERTITQSGVSKTLFTIACIVFMLVGSLVGMYFFGNGLLSIAMGLAMSPLPYLIIYLRSAKIQSLEIDKLESAMSMITNAYAGHFNILSAIENYTREVNKGVPLALRRHTPFDTFVSNTTVVGFSIERSLAILELQISDPYFSNWVKTLRMCSQDRNMVFALFPIIQSMSDHKNMQTEADTRNAAAWRNYLLTVAITLSLAPVLRLLNQDWYNILTKTPIGIILLMLTFTACIASALIVIRVSSRK